MQKFEGVKIKRDDTFKEDSREGGCENERHMELAQDRPQLRPLLAVAKFQIVLLES